MKMMKTTPLFLLTALILFLSSCQKEVSLQNDGTNTNNPGGGNSNDIIGDWNFVGLTIRSTSIVEVEQQGVQLRSVTDADYATQNNTGSVTITTNEFNYTNIGYTVNTVVGVKTYLNGALMDESVQPFELSPDPMSNSTTYVRNSSDSITLKNAVFSITDPAQGDPVDAGESGMKIAWSGDTLLLRMATNFARDIENQGIPGRLTGSFNGTMKLKRK